MAYTPPTASSLLFNFGGGSYAPTTNAGAIQFQFSGAVIVSPGSIAPVGVGAATVFNRTQYSAPGAIAPIGFGTATVLNNARIVTVTGIAPIGFGTLTTILQHRFVLPSGFGPGTWNATNSGTVRNFLQPAAVTGIAPVGFGTTTVINATATQTVAPPGLASVQYGTVIVNPRTVFTSGFTTYGLGVPNVQYPPRPAGFDSSAFGVATVRDNHQDVVVPGLASLAVGQPDARLLQQVAHPPSLLETGLIGDVLVKLQRRYVSPPTVDDGFISPFATVVNVNRYVIPFTGPTTAYGTAAVANASPNLTPVGIVPGAFGTAGAGYFYRYIGTDSLSSAVYGTPTVRNAAATVAPSGFVATSFTAPDVSYFVRTVAPASVSTSGAYGTQTVWFRVRTLSDIGGSDTSLFGTARTDLKDRRVTEATVGDGSAVGAPLLWFRVRTVAPASIAFIIGQQFGAGRVEDATKHVTVGGIAPIGFGAPTAQRNERFIAPAGIVAQYGDASVELHTRYLGARGFAVEEVFGLPLIYNLRQYVVQQFDPDTALLVGRVGTPQEVANRTRTVATFGFDMSSLSRAGTVELGGRDVHPAGLDSQTFGAVVVGDRVRTVYAEGFDAFFSRYNAVHNRSAIIEPSGIPRLHVGVPSIKDTRQFMDAVGGNQFVAFGAAMVADRIRYVNMTVGMEAPRLSDQFVQLFKRYIAVEGMEGGLGVPVVEEHFNIVGAKGYDLARYGAGAVRNVTPEVKVYATLLTEYGRPKVFNYTSHVLPIGFAGGFGLQYVGDRLRRVYPGGFQSLKMSALNDVRFDQPELPAQQTALPEGFDQSVVSRPVVDLRGMIGTGFLATLFGRPTVVSYGIGPVTIPFIDEEMFGMASLNATQYVQQYTVASDDTKVGVPRLNPCTISLSVALRAENIVDYDLVPRYPWFGNGVVTLSRRTIAQTPPPFPPQLFGEPEVGLRKRWVYPVGYRAFRYGIPSIPSEWTVHPFWGRNTEAEVPGVNIDPARYGVATVAFPPDLTHRVYPAGLAGAFGQTQVDLFNRAITNVGGIYGTVFTGAAWVHPPIHLYPTGLASQAFGALQTGLKYRHILVDSTDLDTRWGVEFGGAIAPMKVKLGNFTIKPAGIAPRGVGSPATGPRLRTVRPLGGVFSILPAPGVSSRATVLVGGFDASAMGIPKRPTPGVVEPYGDDLSLTGVPRIDRIMHAPYIEPGVMGQPRVSSGIRVEGMTTIFGDTVVIGESNCGSTLAVIPLLGDTSRFGTHGVHR